MNRYLLIYLIIINLFSFALYGIDKLKAKRHKWRISEAVLLIAAAIGGAVGALLGMLFFRHKTKHIKFIICVPLFLVLQLATFVYFFR